jgi:anti-sigma-K factor RskA
MTVLNHEEVESIAALDAIGAATDDEKRSMQEHLDDCADCRQARDEYAEVATAFALALDPVAPPPDTKARILLSVEAEQEPPVPLATRSRISPWWLATAATLFLALWGWREFGIRVAREQLHSQEAEIKRLAEENALLAQRAETLSNDVSTLAAANTRTIDLAGQAGSPAASARAFVQDEQQRAVVFFYDLPANPNDKSYQLWILRDKVPPESAGVFDVTPTGNASVVVNKITEPRGIRGMAVTLEPRGGVPQPTSATFYVAGQVQGP